MEVIEIARKLSELQQVSEAQNAYFLVLQQTDKDIERYEAALYLLYTGANKKISYTVLLELYKKGVFVDEIMKIMMDFALVPEINEMEKRYIKNVKLLSKYKYIFRKDFKAFEDLNNRFFKYDDNGYVSFDLEKLEFGEYQPIYLHKIRHHFFKDLDNPIKAEDIYSQYELEYLYENVRKSEWVAKDNHIYLCYSNFEEFENYLQIIDFSEILKDKKFVFLFDTEREMYPIDFKEKFEIDYSRHSVKEINLREIKKLIWGVQYASHNGGDFFNEILDGHPNIICSNSQMMEEYNKAITIIRKGLSKEESAKVTDKDIFINILMKSFSTNFTTLDSNSRIVPAVYIQPHFSNLNYSLEINGNVLQVNCPEINEIDKYEFIREFKYIKTFVPIRRFTNSVAATTCYTASPIHQAPELVMTDALGDRLNNKNLYVNKQERTYIDSVAVRFEDGKLNPKATFTALAAFLDVPYTQSMTYCSLKGKLNPESLKGNTLGFDPSSVYKTYDEYTDNAERIVLEYFYRDSMIRYGYDFWYYNGSEITKEELHSLADKRGALYSWMMKRRINYELNCNHETEEIAKEKAKKLIDIVYEKYQNRLHLLIDILYTNLSIVNNEGIALELMEPLKLDESLLERPLYR